MEKDKPKTRLVRIATEAVEMVERAVKPTKTPIGYYFEIAAKEKIKKQKK